jgi:UDP-N-acetylmuramoyl-L-alanyl-D-glutamate--2,6-diaminopimelate ligase
MGRVSVQLADITILTAEDPRNEDLKDINNDIVNFAKQYKGVVIRRFANTLEFKKLNISDLKAEIKSNLAQGYKPIIAFDENAIASRVDAINLACRLANSDDIVFCTGKAHEESICFGDKEFKWSEHKTVKDALVKLKQIKK